MIYHILCDQCQVCIINGVPCHEIGCPEAWKPWIYDSEQGLVYPGLKDSVDAEDLDTVSDFG